MKILYLASEVTPFARAGGLGDVTGALPKALKDLNQEIRIMMPKYKFINERKYVLREVIRLRNIPVTIDGRTEYANVKSAFLPESKVQIYFIEVADFFNKPGIYHDPHTNEPYEDNAIRYAFFAKAAMETLKTLSWQPDLIHCNDWQTAYVPVYLKTLYQGEDFFKGIKTVYTLHNLTNQGDFDKSIAKQIDFDENEVKEDGMFGKDSKLNLTKAAIYFSDFITTVSENYADEIIERDDIGYGFGKLLEEKGEFFEGILNGVDYTVWTPEKDKALPTKYSFEEIEGKEENKKALLMRLGLEYREGRPLLGMISKLTEQKGIDILIEALPELMKLDVQLCIMGEGDPEIAETLMEAQKTYAGLLSINVTYDDKIAHLIEAGADIYLMPSKYEPCGLNQIFSLRYGTLPVVSPIGGLLDTVEDYDPTIEDGTGFIMEKLDAPSLVEATKRAIALYKDKEKLRAVQKQIMAEDFSWDISAKRYLDIYKRVTGE
ncbi:MAG TPA: glycogen synthase [Caldithrix abyssi]|uniref:Glycogen synthase n=1 Tax=Caldithrix abyssi TaxID=187145 RepID=A0A7V1LLQ1_CALAY|nr:glycogen synthase [Caldithrix abyssi]